MACPDEQSEKQWLVDGTAPAKNWAMSLSEKQVVVDRKYVVRGGQRVYLGCDFPDELNPGVVPLGDVGTNCTDDREGCCCGFIPAMHADGTTPTSIGAGGNMVTELSGDPNEIEHSWHPEVDYGGSACQKCSDAADNLGAMNLIAYQQLTQETERYVYTTWPTCKPYPLFKKCALPDGTAWWGGEDHLCSANHPAPTVQEMRDPTPGLIEFHSASVGQQDWVSDFSDGVIDAYRGCYRGFVVCQEHNFTDGFPDFLPVDTSGYPWSGSILAEPLYSKRKFAASVIMEITVPTGGPGSPVGGSISVRWLSDTWFLSAFDLNNPPTPLHTHTNAGGAYPSGSVVLDGMVVVAPPGGCGTAKTKVDSGNEQVVLHVGKARPRSWKALTGDPSGKLVSTDWEWDDVRCKWRLRKGWSAKLIEFSSPNQVSNTAPPPGWPGCDSVGALTCNGSYTATPGAEAVELQDRSTGTVLTDACAYNEPHHAGTSIGSRIWWTDNSYDTPGGGSSGIPITRKWGIGVIFGDQPTAEDVGPDHASPWHCQFKNFTISL